MIDKHLNKDEFRKFAVKGQGINGLSIDRYVQTVENMTRSVIEERPTRFAEIDVFSRLIMDRIIFLGLPVDDNISNIITAQLLFLQSTDAKKDIQLYVNSPGGSVYAGLGIYDTMQYVSPDIATICTGLAASMAAVLLAGGEKGKRSALKQTLSVKKDLYEILARHSGQKYDQIEKDSDRDFWMRAAEAKAYGLIDEVLETK